MSEPGQNVRAAAMASTLEDVPARGAVLRRDNRSRLFYSAHSHLIIAVSRTICAFVLLLFVLTDPPVAVGRIGSDGAIALAFASFAIVALIISLRSWYLDFAFSEAFIVTDILVFAALAISRAAVDSGSAALALCLIVHILFSSGLRWRSGTVFVIAAFLNTLWIADIVLFELPRRGAIQASTFHWSLVVALMSLIVGWASTQLLKISSPRYFGGVPAPELPLAASAIEYAMRSTCASDAILCWIDRENLGCYMYSSGMLEDGLLPSKLSFRAADSFRNLVPMLFDTSRGRAIVAEDRDFVARAVASVPGLELLAELDAKAGICIPIDDGEERSWLILTGIPGLGWGHLYLARTICAEIAQGLSCQMASAAELDSALFRLRRTVACDLHDSVAHSLAGARFLLVALRFKVDADSEVAKEIDTIKNALDAEHLHVRRLIEQLRETDSDPRVRNLVEDIQALRPALEARWQIEIDPTDSDFRIDVPVWLSLEVQQLVREAVSNGVRHGQASTVAIKCQRRLGMITIEVTDNGSGFPDPQAPTLPRSISERLEELGGALEIVSAPGSTMLRMRIHSSTAS